MTQSASITDEFRSQSIKHANSLKNSTERLEMAFPLITRNIDQHQMKKTEPTSSKMPELAPSKNFSQAYIGINNISSTFSPSS